MLLVITGVGFLIHAYSVGYMHGDAEEKRFFAYLNLFVFSMLILVLAGNFVLLLVGWGMVGLSSYLLIAFWWQRPSAVAAGKKAFVMNAVGDVGIALGIFVIFNHAHSVSYPDVFGVAKTAFPLGSHTANWVALLLLVGAVAKSAQLPLQTWLPDAMEGPTPVSALIHAATMVTAGVYLVARMWPLYEQAPQVHHLVAIIGAATLTMAGLIALVQVDIKRVIAYSTMSQIGYMFCGVGLGANAAGMFHLVTHAFFKALLFLGAGVVIHALSDEQDIRKMGGMSRWLPWTTVLMWVGALALAGIPPFSGFFSKDPIIAAGLAAGGWTGWIVFSLGLAGALVTGLYTFRMIFLVFHGPPSPFAAEHAPAHTAHGEGPFSMLWTITILGIGAAGIGVLQIPGVTEGMKTFLETSAPTFVDPTSSQEWLASTLSPLLGLAGIIAAYALYGGHERSDAPSRASRAMAPLPRVFEEKFGFDIAYDWLFYKPAAGLARLGVRFWEGVVVGGGVAGVGAVSRWTASRLNLIQSGIVRTYAVTFALGLAALMVWFLAKGSA
jgi:NADH-quinone oxidoreductase subunit L